MLHRLPTRVKDVIVSSYGAGNAGEACESSGQCTRVCSIRADLPVDTTRFARFLIGKMLVRKLAEGVAGGRIVETEAYPVGDAAGHAYRGITPHTRTLFLERGVGAGVLIRAIEPTDGIGIIKRNRDTERLRDLARGPGRLCASLGIDRGLDGIDLCRRGPLWLGSAGEVPFEIGQGKRIGINRAAGSPLRFYVRDNPFVSGPRALNR